MINIPEYAASWNSSYEAEITVPKRPVWVLQAIHSTPGNTTQPCILDDMEYRPRYCLPHHNAIIMGGCMQHTQTENGVIPRFRHSRTAVWVTIPSELQQWQFWVERGWVTVVAPRSINRKLFAHSFKVWFDLRKREYEVIPNLSGVASLYSGLY